MWAAVNINVEHLLHNSSWSFQPCWKMIVFSKLCSHFISLSHSNNFLHGFEFLFLMSETAHLCGYPGGGGEGRSHSREVCVEVSATKAFETANPVEDKNCSVCYPV